MKTLYHQKRGNLGVLSLAAFHSGRLIGNILHLGYKLNAINYLQRQNRKAALLWDLVH